MRVKILAGCTEESINEAIKELEDRKRTITKVTYYPETHGHYKSYCLIEHKKSSIS